MIQNKPLKTKVGCSFDTQPACGALSHSYFCARTHIYETAAIICVYPVTVYRFSCPHGAAGGGGLDPIPAVREQVASLSQGHIERKTGIGSRTHTYHAEKYLVIKPTDCVTDITPFVFGCGIFARPSAVQSSPSRKDTQINMRVKNFRCTSILFSPYSFQT